MNFIKICAIIMFSMKASFACELPIRVMIQDAPSFGSCKGLILHVIEENSCPQEEIEAVTASPLVKSVKANGVSFCTLTTKRGVYSAMEDVMSEPPVSTVFFSIWD